MVTLHVVKQFSRDGNVYDVGRVFETDEASAYIIFNRYDHVVEMVPGSEQEIYGTGIMKGMEQELTRLQMAAGMTLEVKADG